VRRPWKFKTTHWLGRHDAQFEKHFFIAIWCLISNKLCP